jgi:hypothetical protein
LPEIIAVGAKAADKEVTSRFNTGVEVKGTAGKMHPDGKGSNGPPTGTRFAKG